jgi:amidohydrolase
MRDHPTGEPPDHVTRETIGEIGAAIEPMRSSMIAFRRQMHAHPEASGKEVDTTQRIIETLAAHGLHAKRVKGGTGATLDLPHDASPARRIAFRCDLDAVAVDDTKNAEYASTRPGLCHACGHDAHTTIAVYTAILLKDRLAAATDVGIRFLFQPAEEDGTGAQFMIDSGGIDGVTAAYALHVDPFLGVGRVSTRKGAMTSACWAFEVTVTGRGGHSARPDEACDPIIPLIELYQKVSDLGREVAVADSPMVLCVTTLCAGKAINAVPSTATLAGTLRGGDESALQIVCRRIEDLARKTAKAASCSAVIEFPTTFPTTVNAPPLVDHAVWVGEQVFGASNVVTLPSPSMGAEDFAQYGKHLDTCMVRIGAALNDEHDRSPLHAPGFDLNEEVLFSGVQYISLLLLTAIDQFLPSPSRL